MVEEILQGMSFKKKGLIRQPLKTFKVNDSTIIAVYRGTLSQLDILIKYRQKLQDKKRWSRIRTPKHIHWIVDILMKMQSYGDLTKEFLDFFINIWNKTVPLKNEAERQSLDLEAMLSINKNEIKKFQKLSEKGEYSVRFLILLAKLLMLQEKTNRSDAYMFKRVLDSLRKEEDLFHILATATLRKR